MTSSKVPTIGFLIATTYHAWQQFIDAFELQLKSHGWDSSEGGNIKIEYQSASGLKDLYERIAKDFANPKRPYPTDIIVTGGTGSTLACKNATKTIPIVFATAGDPVGSKLVQSLPKPGGNVTGISNEQTIRVKERLNYMQKHLAGDLGKIHVGAIGNINVPNVKLEMKELKIEAKSLGLKYSEAHLKTLADIHPAIKSLKRKKVDGLFVCTDPLITTNADILNEWALLEKLGTMHALRENFGNEGLMFHGPVMPDMFKRAADFVDMILNGKKPAQIPIEGPTTFESKCNKRTAQILGLKSLAATL